MLEVENMCVGCAECIGCGRKFWNAEYHVCDHCGEVIDHETGYDFDDMELCGMCACEQLWNERFVVDGKLLLKMGDTARALYEAGDVAGMSEYLNVECPASLTE